LSDTKKKIRPKDRATIIQALRAGVVPRSGLHHVQVGRSDELAQLNNDIDLIADGGSSASNGQARNLFAELTRNMATRTKADGGALSSIVERFVSRSMKEADEQNTSAEALIEERLAPLEGLVAGYDFTKVVTEFFFGATTGDEERKSNALRWLRAEFTTKTDARKTLGVRTIIDDANIYDYL